MTVERSSVRVTLVRDGAEVACRWLGVDPHGQMDVAEALARIVLVARRSGCTVALDGADPGLCEVLGLLGLVVVPRGGQLVVEVRREVEDGEEVWIDEVVVTDDPVP